MDLKVITRHAPSNYGSLMQSIATVEVIRQLGHECTIIDYQRPDERGLRATLTALRSKPRWNRSLLTRSVYVALRWPTEQYARWRFDRFREHYLPMTKRYTSSAELSALKADLFVTGSDQVWGPIGCDSFDPVYFLDFAGSRRFALAASFGRETLEAGVEEAVMPLLRRYDLITVRESSAADMINRWGLPLPATVIDPTLMVSADFWRGMARKSDASDGKYILIYQIHNNPALDRYAVELARETGLELRRLSPSTHQISRPGKLILLPDPGEFISCIDNAAMMITDSFHGTCFAINLGTQFVTVIPSNGTGTRNRNILREFGLTGRIVHGTAEEAHRPDNPIDFKEVSTHQKKVREESLAYIKKALSSL